MKRGEEVREGGRKGRRRGWKGTSYERNEKEGGRKKGRGSSNKERERENSKKRKMCGTNEKERERKKQRREEMRVAKREKGRKGEGGSIKKER